VLEALNRQLFRNVEFAVLRMLRLCVHIGVCIVCVYVCIECMIECVCVVCVCVFAWCVYVYTE